MFAVESAQFLPSVCFPLFHLSYAVLKTSSFVTFRSLGSSSLRPANALFTYSVFCFDEVNFRFTGWRVKPFNLSCCLCPHVDVVRFRLSLFLHVFLQLLFRLLAPACRQETFISSQSPYPCTNTCIWNCEDDRRLGGHFLLGTICCFAQILVHKVCCAVLRIMDINHKNVSVEWLIYRRLNSYLVWPMCIIILLRLCRYVYPPLWHDTINI